MNKLKIKFAKAHPRHGGGTTFKIQIRSTQRLINEKKNPKRPGALDGAEKRGSPP